MTEESDYTCPRYSNDLFSRSQDPSVLTANLSDLSSTARVPYGAMHTDRPDLLGMLIIGSVRQLPVILTDIIYAGDTPARWVFRPTEAHSREHVADARFTVVVTNFRKVVRGDIP